MTTFRRQIMFSVAMSFFILCFFMAAFFTAYPLKNWTLLWDMSVMNIPFLLFALLISLGMGVIIGVISGIILRRNIDIVAASIQTIQDGAPLDEKKMKHYPELKVIWNRLDKLQKKITDQAKASQKLANANAEDQEGQIQELIFQERNRLARELHDSVSQDLFAASMMMSALTESKVFEGLAEAKQFKLVETMIQQSQIEMRALLLHLRPVALKGKTLQEGIEQLLNELGQKVPMDISWKIEDFPLEKGVEEHLFRILQESISNTLRHAKAGKLEILLVQRDEWIILRVTDDGIGFDPEEQAKAGSYGLQNMKERALEIGGALKIVSLKNKGTRLEAKVPFVKSGGDQE